MAYSSPFSDIVLRRSPIEATTARVNASLVVPATTVSFTVMMMPASDKRASSRAYPVPRTVPTSSVPTTRSPYRRGVAA